MGSKSSGAGDTTQMYQHKQNISAQLTKFLRDRRVYCSDPASMNDPLGFQTRIRLAGPMIIDPGSLNG
jgi:hypothetical protein